MELLLAFWAQPTGDKLTQIGALTGFIAFLIKLYEFRRDHYDRYPKLRVSAALTSDPRMGNTVVILNASKVPTSIYNYSLLAPVKSWNWLSRNRLWQWFRGERFWRGAEIEFSYEWASVKIAIPAHGQTDLDFSEGDYFQSFGRKRDLYLQIYTSAREAPYHFRVADAA